MKVYRGPATKDFSHDSHELVATADVSSSLRTLSDSFLLKVNVTKEPTERQAVAHLRFDNTDVIALHEQMLKGLIARSDALTEAQAKMKRASETAFALFEYVNEMARLADDGEESSYENILDMIGSIISEIDQR